MAQEKKRTGVGAAAGEEPVDQEDEEAGGFDGEWILPAVLLLVAKGVRAFGDEGVWNWLAVGLGVLAAIVTVGVFVSAVRRRAYETLIIAVVGVMIAGVITYAR
ncbi:hypothetical protein [Actinomadura macrotermitis]|uniref:Uncharacterized protein n=1 Tax=Actinomadura macrotermitis TaxID=2585200 RepID=A0A7K0BX90_9ACTN|nr:hypothetical protein [Actinomadura macrotermitis]MQY05686.1 hypothetical protein [Actinomadura macrotermitis]